MGCGCASRQEWLNQRRPGLGDRVAALAEPVRAHAADLVIGALGVAVLWLWRR